MADPVTIGLAVAGTALSAYGSYAQGSAANAAAKSQALQYEAQAGAERAASQRAAIEERRKARIMSGNAVAAAAASGGGVSDPTVGKIIGDIAGEGQYRAMMRMYEGNQQSNNLLAQAQATREEGKAAKRAGTIQAISTLVSGASSMYSKYWPKAETATSPMGSTYKVTDMNRGVKWRY